MIAGAIQAVRNGLIRGNTTAIVMPVELADRLRERVPPSTELCAKSNTVNFYGIRVYEADPEDCASLAQELTDAGEKVLLVLSQDASAT